MARVPPPELRDGLVGRTGRESDAPGVAPSDRDGEVRSPIAPGFTDRRIAEPSDVGGGTVGTLKACAAENLGVDDRAGIVEHAIRAGWLSGG
jgi:DNA-binding NarL/FixJ family response regulator